MSFNIVHAEIPALDGCQILTRTKAYIVDQGVCGTLEHVFMDRKGLALDLSAFDEGAAPPSTPSTESVGSEASIPSEPIEPLGKVVLRVKELTAAANCASNPLYEVDGTFADAAGGVVQARLPSEVVQDAGIYQLSWGILDASETLQLVNDGLLSVERSLFGESVRTQYRIQGPPTINEIRMHIMDSSGAENLLLDDVEFHFEQIAAAVTKPIRQWEESPPPLRTRFDTRNFPYKHNWLEAIAGHLFMAAAHNYRRNHLPYQAGGLAIDDKGKEQQYLQAGQMLLQGWKEFMMFKKFELNARECVGAVGSSYG